MNGQRLIVMRHAKSSWKQPLADHERPLKLRGIREAQRAAIALKELGWIPSTVISSDAVRTRQTWANMESFFEESIAVHFRHELYLAGMAALTEALDDIRPQTTPTLVLGHNPGWSAVVSHLSGQATELKTAQAALLVGPGLPWGPALQAAGSWRLEQVIWPRALLESRTRD